ncbi:MAG: TatD family hydrolase [Deltaproteobacteria bacterium]|nr:TatD family hydrolase [Deltaproteobacteria bacterium]
MLIDSHAHIDFESFDEDRLQVIERAQQAGVKHIIQIALGPEEEKFARAYQVVTNNPQYFMAAGLHPHDADHFTSAVQESIIQYLQKERVVALGEIGLDYCYDHSDRNNQKKCFDTLMEVAIKHDKPICIHTRDAHDDTVALTQNQDIFAQAGGVIHCFTGSKDQVKDYLNLGAYISFSGVVTFKKAVDLQEAAKYVPLDRMLIETDCPFLAPTPYRGKRNEPAYVIEVAKTIAMLKGISLEEVAQASFANTNKVFKLGL